ncbi:DUF2637 domain-containing protein [Streptomyces sp. HNM0574]|uniref:DUF2637 domain-containing protein n=1 Tax=Streptomyces sp. HNM0574 TaxID=2714954 RepID=UPI00146E6CB5|nr:DUF2637 domain-containing protein [Streptomyces sp. HNM0574]NLU70251.1 DUF2637 domain-containing protein [Streptomyces sp. HNM0574]
MTRTHRILIGVVVAGAVVIAAIGFAGSYAAVRELAEKKGFGAFAPFFPIGIDAGIVVLLALDLLLTWIRIPFPLLRQTAWLLTAATIAFNGAAAWPDPLGVGMHAVIPVLFVVAVEAARHAVGRIADITADRHMEGVRVSRWLLAFPSTFRLWRRMKLWELRSYDEVIRMEQDRLVYETRLRARYGRNWRRRAPVEALMPLKLARYGIPLTETAPETTRRTPAPVPGSPAPTPALDGPVDAVHGEPATHPSPAAAPSPAPAAPEPAPVHEPAQQTGPAAHNGTAPPAEPQPYPEAQAEPAPQPGPQPQTADRPHPEPEPTQLQPELATPAPVYAAGSPASGPQVTVPVSPGRRRTLGSPDAEGAAPEAQFAENAAAEVRPAAPDDPAPVDPVGIPDEVPREEFYFLAYREYVAAQGGFPSARQLSRTLHDGYGVTEADGSLLRETYLGPYMREFKERYNTEMGLAG